MWICPDIIVEWNIRMSILCFCALLFAILIAKLSENIYVNNWIQKIINKSIHDDIWQDVIDYNNGTTLRLVCSDATYTGVLVCHEEKGNDSWFVLEDYIVSENGYSYKSEDLKYPARLAINIGSVKRIELFYSNE